MTCSVLEAIPSVTAQCKCATCGRCGAQHLLPHDQSATTLGAQRVATHALFCRDCCPVHGAKLEHLQGEIRDTEGKQERMFE